MLSTPLICSSSGVATVSETTRGLAPGNCARTTTCGGATSGYSEIGSWKMDSSPTRKMKSEVTVAKRGRSMKKREMSIAAASGFGGRRGAEHRRAAFIDLDRLRCHRRTGEGAQQAFHDHELAGLHALHHAHAVDERARL